MNPKELVIGKVQASLGLASKKDAENLVNRVVEAIEQTLVENLGINQFSLKLNSLGRFTVRHRPGIRRKIPWSGEIMTTQDARKVKFIPLGALRAQEKGKI
jgi:nucleoid DNA-binding protein